MNELKTFLSNNMTDMTDVIYIYIGMRDIQYKPWPTIITRTTTTKPIDIETIEHSTS